jgi:hypothetical protein
MPSLEFARQRANGLWKGEVKKIEVTTTYLVDDEEIFKEELDDVNFKIIQLESDRDNVGSDEVIKYIKSELRELYLKREVIERALKTINEGR